MSTLALPRSFSLATMTVAIAAAASVLGCAGGADDPSAEQSSAAEPSAAPTVRRATDTWQALEGNWSRVVGEFASLDFDVDARTCNGADDAPYCFRGALADGTAIQGGYFVVDGTLVIRWRDRDGQTTSHAFRFDPRSDAVPSPSDDHMTLYEGHTLAASLFRCVGSCPPVTWGTR